MLTTLCVRHFAVVEEVEVDFRRGLTVITGETGAGKSLLVDALMLLSGARADNGMIRPGAERAELSAEFDLTGLDEARRWLQDEELDEGDTCQLRRVLRADGPSRAWINGRRATTQQLAVLAPLMLEIHGQHEHQALLSRRHQLALLDGNLADDATGTLPAIRACARRWHAVNARERALAGTDNPEEKMALLRHELTQLQQCALAPEALEELTVEHKQLANAGDLVLGCQALLGMLEGDGDMTLEALLARLQAQLEQLAGRDPRLQPMLELVTSAGIQLGEADIAIRHYAQDIDLNPERLAEIEQMFSRLHELSRRHHVPPEQLQAVAKDIEAQLTELENVGATLQELAAERQRLAQEYTGLADALSAARRMAANTLGHEVTALMQELGMRGGRFEIHLDQRENDEPDASGRERAEFMVSTNPGLPLRALRKVASGGELARISLAVAVATLGNDSADTMIFDEVDSGIGGAVAEIVGQKLRALGERCQTLCVTHLPQVAAQGHVHITVSKRTEGGHTATVLNTLDVDARRAELARMLGGVDITRETRAHARQMLEQAQG